MEDNLEFLKEDIERGDPEIILTAMIKVKNLVTRSNADHAYQSVIDTGMVPLLIEKAGL